MITRVRKLGEGEWVDVEHEAGDCVFCELARGGLKSAGEIVFFESDAGAVQRTECIAVVSDGLAAFFCVECTREEALQEIASALEATT